MLFRPSKTHVTRSFVPQDVLNLSPTSLVRLLAQSLTHSLIHSFIHSLADPGLNVRGRGHIPSLPSLPYLPSFLPPLFLLFSSPVPPFFPLSLSFLPLEVGPPRLRIGSPGERLSSPSRSGQSPPARRILVYFRHKFALF